jgi:hypothetical protein
MFLWHTFFISLDIAPEVELLDIWLFYYQGFWGRQYLGLISGLIFIRQVLYLLRHALALFALVIFQVGSGAFCLVHAWMMIFLSVPLIYVVMHHHFCFVEMGSCYRFFLSLVPIMILPISTS